MSLFQSTVVSKYLQTQNKELLATQWSQFKSFFHNPEIQENIRNSKEEQYQGEFLIDLFVNILGYTKNPTPNYNLTTEYKNIKDSKKADGAIIIHENVKAVIELKGTNTTDLGKIETQAFGYKNNQSECSYVITSNFEKLRFYIDNAIEHIEFNLFNLTEKDFELLYLCLAYDNILKDIPKKLKDESVGQEDVITKKLYNDYSLFKRELHQSLVSLNPEYDALILFKKSQKLIDRFLFLFFAEDRQLLPPNSVRLILEQWKQLKELDAYAPLFDRFKKYFGYLNTGHKGKQYDVYAYNGGLFKPDKVLDTIKIDDDVLYKHTFKLSEYDFISEVDVNILGHIFENSLNELDEITAQLEGQEVDKTKTKRKKDGVFYTPKYITKYIVDNTIGKLCEEKKTSLQIVEEEYSSTRGTTSCTTRDLNPWPNPKKKKQELFTKLTDYRNWLLELTICDPACGSGAFLNQALDYLITEHKYIDELQAKLFGDAMVLSDVEKSILENNLFGVDINEESVEIAKLSLWLRTAQPNRKLNDLNNNIKCGNSLIDDIEIAGEKAFNWQQEFPQVFKEKNKKAFHITTAVHDSRTSERMIEFKVREKRDLGTNPYPNINYFTEEDEFVITQTIANIVKDDHLNVLAYNICADHIHLLLVCEEEEMPKIVQKIKSITSKNCTQNRTTIEQDSLPNHNITREHAPLPQHQTTEYDSLPDQNKTREHAPLPNIKKQNPLWTQKFGCKEITTEEYLFTAIDYIKHNRSKHHLPQHSNKEFKLLVESIICSYEHAFRQEYKGGFDVVIGNPPYTYRNAISEKEKEYFKRNYNSTEGNFDLYKFFIERLILVTKSYGYSSLIVPNTFLSALTYKKLREIIINEFKVLELFDLGLDVFENVVVESLIFNFKKEKTITQNTLIKIDRIRTGNYFSIENTYTIDLLKYYKKDNNFNIYLSSEIDNIISKTQISKIDLGKITYCTVGINTGYIKDDLTSNIKLDDRYHKMLNGKNIGRNYVEWNGEWVMYDVDFVKSKGDKGRSLPPEYIFTSEKILVQRTRRGMKRKLVCYYDIDKYYNLNRISNIILKDDNYSLKYVFALLNSELLDFYFNKYFNEYEVKPFHLALLPIKILSKEDQQPFIEKADLMLSLNKELQEVSLKFQRSLEREFFDKGFKPLASEKLKPLAIEINNALANEKLIPFANKGLKPLASEEPKPHDINPLSKKLQDWYLLSYGEFIKELEKKKVKLSLSQKAEWETYFLQEAKKAQDLKTTIDTTDKQIDQMVYELYGLTEEEISIIENS